MCYVYVLIDEQTGKNYTGYSSNLKRRLVQHQNGHGAKTTCKGDWKLVYYESYLDKADAIRRESRLKQDGRARRQLLERIQQSVRLVKIGAGGCGRQSGVTKAAPDERSGKSDHRR